MVRGKRCFRISVETFLHRKPYISPHSPPEQENRPNAKFVSPDKTEQSCFWPSSFLQSEFLQLPWHLQYCQHLDNNGLRVTLIILYYIHTKSSSNLDCDTKTSSNLEIRRHTPFLPLRLDWKLSFLMKPIVRAGSGDPEPYNTTLFV